MAIGETGFGKTYEKRKKRGFPFFVFQLGERGFGEMRPQFLSIVSR
jgi:hypothetical protein